MEEKDYNKKPEEAPKKAPKPEETNTSEEKKQSEEVPAIGGKPPKISLFLVLFMFVILPILVVYFYQAGSAKADKLTQSQFEQALTENRVISCEFLRDPATGKDIVKGVFLRDKDSVKLVEEAGNQGSEQKKIHGYNFKAEVIYTENLDQLIRSSKTNLKVGTQDHSLRDFLTSIVPFILILVILYFLFVKQLRSAGKGAMQFGKSKAKLQDGNGKKVTFKDVAGLDEVKEEVEEVVHYLKDPGKVRDLGGQVPKGILMVGPPGTGKTLLARAIAGEADAPFYSISGSDFVEMFVGVGASRVRDMFEQAKKNAPCLIFIDEIDAVGRARFAGIGGGNDEREQTLNALLVEMDGFEANSGIIVIAATNRPDVLDKALLRPGRFDRQINVDVPNRKGREEILAVHAKKIKLSDNVELDIVARNTPGFSGADLANLLNEAALIAARADKKAVDMEDMEEAKEKVVWGRERRSYKMSERSRRNTAYHEAGHALVALHQEHAMPLHKVTIIPRGKFLGAAMYLPKDDEVSRTEAEIKAQLAMTMGGRIAEKLIFGDVSTGAANDIMVATKTAKMMVCQWGMSDEMGLIDYAPSRDNPYSASDDTTKGSQHSDETSNKIDREVRRIIDQAVKTATDILTENRDQLEKFAEALLDKETMEVAEICELLGIDPKSVDKERFSEEAQEEKPATEVVEPEVEKSEDVENVEDLEENKNIENKSGE